MKRQTYQAYVTSYIPPFFGFVETQGQSPPEFSDVDRYPTE